MPPFIVFALPRSRTAWLSQFLSYRDWTCGHDEARHARSMDDVKAWFKQPNTGTVETSIAPWWRTVQRIAPDTRVVVVRRPVQDVVESLLRLGLPFDRAALEAEMKRHDRKLDQIERRMKNVLSVSFYDLALEDTCAKVFEHCLPYQHDTAWWAHTAPQNIQINMLAMMRYMIAYRPQIGKLTEQAKWLELAEFAKAPQPEADDIVISEEPFEKFYEDGQKLFDEHFVTIGGCPGDAKRTNLEMYRSLEQVGCLQVLTARCNGRMAGYLMSFFGPGFECPGKIVGENLSFFASPDFKGVGRRLQLASKEALRRKGVDELFLRAGIRGDGPRLGTLYKRMGAEAHGQVFRLHLKD